jgi:hypothetical protein
MKSLNLLPLSRLSMLLSLILGVLVFSFIVQPYLHLSWDSVTYIHLAKSIVYQSSYEYDNIPHIKYPPGFPLILAATIYFLNGNNLHFRTLIALFGITTVLFLNLLSQKTYDIAEPSNRLHRFIFPTLTCLLLISDIRFCISTSYVLADVPFTAVLIVSIYFSLTVINSSTISYKGMLIPLIANAFLSSLRIVGVALGGALVIWNIFFWRSSSQRRRINVLLLIGANVFLPVFWLLRSSLLAPVFPYDTLDHVGYLPELFTSGMGTASAKQVSLYGALDRIQENLHHIFQQLLVTLSNQSLNSWYGIGIASVLFVPLIVGATPTSPVAWFLILVVLIYGAIVAIWEAEQGLRFFVPMAPLLYLYITKGIQRIYAGSNRYIRAGIWLLIASILIVRFEKIGDFIRYEQTRPYPRTKEEQQWLDSGQWLAENLSKNQIFLAEDAPVLAYLSLRRGYAAPPDPDRLSSYVTALDIEYILNRENMPWTDTIDKFAQNKGYPPVAQISGFRIYHVIPNG